MNEITSDEAVRAYLRRALQAAGGESALARLLGFQRGKVKGWFEDGDKPVGIYGRDLFAVARVTGISLDEYARMQELPPDLETRIDQLRHDHEHLAAEFAKFKEEVEAGLLAQWLRDRQVTVDDVRRQVRDAGSGEAEAAQDT